jgi:hypothetical protein
MVDRMAPMHSTIPGDRTVPAGDVNWDRLGWRDVVALTAAVLIACAVCPLDWARERSARRRHPAGRSR